MRRLTLWLACVVSLLAGGASSHEASSYGGMFRSRDLGAAWLTGNAASSDTARMVSTTPMPTLSLGNLRGNNPRPSKVRAVNRGHVACF